MTLSLSKYSNDVSATWFWGRVNPRTKKLAYIEGGFQHFIDELGKRLKKDGVKIKL